MKQVSKHGVPVAMTPSQSYYQRGLLATTLPSNPALTLATASHQPRILIDQGGNAHPRGHLIHTYIRTARGIKQPSMRERMCCAIVMLFGGIFEQGMRRELQRGGRNTTMDSDKVSNVNYIQGVSQINTHIQIRTLEKIKLIHFMRFKIQDVPK